MSTAAAFLLPCIASFAGAAAAPAAAPAGGWLGWEAVDVPMLLSLPILLVASGFFSGSETALFGLTDAERLVFQRRDTLAHRTVSTLLADQRMLLITILLGNMTINVLYFVMSSVLMRRSTVGGLGEVGLAAASLLLVVAVGEVGPKLLASAVRVRFATLTAPLLLTMHRAIGPLRVPLHDLVVAPLSRLTAPNTTPPELGEQEMKALLDISGAEGVIDTEEQRILREVLDMRRLRVRDVMTPRVKMVAVPATASRAEVDRLTRENRLTKIPVYASDPDEILGVLQVKQYLLDPTVRPVTDPEVMTPPNFVPDLADLEQLLEHFRRSRSKSAIVVDEYGGTEGVVSVEDVVEELVGDIVGMDETDVVSPQLIGLGAWRITGEQSVHDFAEAFGLDLADARITTVGGVIADRLGRRPEPGDRVEVEHLTIEVERVERGRVVTAVARLRDLHEGIGDGEKMP